MNTVTLPDGPSLPRFVQGGIAIAAPLWMMRRLHERYGSAFKINVPIFGDAVVISDPAEVKQLFMTSPEIADILDVNVTRPCFPMRAVSARTASSAAGRTPTSGSRSAAGLGDASAPPSPRWR